MARDPVTTAAAAHRCRCPLAGNENSNPEPYAQIEKYRHPNGRNIEYVLKRAAS